MLPPPEKAARTSAEQEAKVSETGVEELLQVWESGTMTANQCEGFSSEILRLAEPLTNTSKPAALEPAEADNCRAVVSCIRRLCSVLAGPVNDPGKANPLVDTAAHILACVSADKGVRSCIAQFGDDVGYPK